MQIPQNIKAWLNARYISDEILEQAKISWINNSIAIPVNNENGEFLFYKYRKNPLEENDLPKYRYDKGGHACLYGLDIAKGEQSIIICEGELDCLTLNSQGHAAVSSTGGAGTFKKEWADYLSFRFEDIFICLDLDEAGFSGAFNIQRMIPRARIIFLPETLGAHADVTNFFQSQSPIIFTDLMMSAIRFIIPESFLGEPKSKVELKSKIKEDSEVANYYLTVRLNLLGHRKSVKYIDVLLKMITDSIDTDKKLLNTMGQHKQHVNNGDDRLASAKRVPIDTFIKFNSARMARCIWHDEKSASMYYYKNQERVKCFGCGKMGDVIDVVQQLNFCTINEAIKIILHD